MEPCIGEPIGGRYEVRTNSHTYDVSPPPAAPNVFAIESFIDELAYTSKQDPTAFRLRDPRLGHVLEMVQDRSGLSRPRQPGHGFRAACSIYHGTYIAEVAEVTVSSRREGKIERAWAAVDAVRLVHPDRERNQIESGIQQAASWTLHEELKHYGSEVTTTSWRDLPHRRPFATRFARSM